MKKPEETLTAYVQAFASFVPDAVVPFYHVPCMFIAPGRVTLAPDVDTARAVATMLMEHARSQDYRRSEILKLETRMLAERLATLSGVFVRFDSHDREISRFGFAYTMSHDGDDWRIVVAVAHDAPSL